MKTLGIVGGGQLGRMLAEAARPLGVRVIVLDPTPECPAHEVADAQIVGDFRDYDTVKSFAKECDVMTFEIESANAEALAELAVSGFPVHPTPETLALIRDKFAQKELLSSNGIAVAPYRRVDNEEEARAAGEMLGYPFVLKARSGGYDGKGNAQVERKEDIPGAMNLLGGNLYAEGFVRFEKELAVVAVRTEGGEIRVYPVVETMHENHICVFALVPARVDETIAKKAETLAHKVLEQFKGAGVFAIEMFLADGEVLINEIAPRVHNSGHLTIEACETSQFENHVRAVLGLPLGAVNLKVPAAAMANILGDRNGAAEPRGGEDAEALGEVAVHWYGKKETKTGRKMAHLTAVAATAEEAFTKAQEARKRVSI